MNPVIQKLHEAQLRKDLPEFRPGDTIRVHVRLMEGEGEKVKERIQTFEGVVISKKGRASSASFTVRRVSFGVGIERIFPLHSPSISSIDVVTSSARATFAVRACITCATCVARPPASSAPRVKNLRRPLPPRRRKGFPSRFREGRASARPFFLARPHHGWATYQIVFNCLEERMFLSFVTRPQPKARAVAPIKRSHGS